MKYFSTCLGQGAESDMIKTSASSLFGPPFRFAASGGVFCRMPSMFDRLEVQVLSQPDGGEG
jgi:hypothetical protein